MIKNLLRLLGIKLRPSKSFFIAESQRLGDALQTVAEENVALKSQLHNAETALRVVVPEFSRFVEFIISRLRPEDYGDDAQPLPEIMLAKRAVDNFHKYQELPLPAADALEIAVGAFASKTNLPTWMLEHALGAFLSFAGSLIERDDEGVIRADSFKKFEEYFEQMRAGCSKTATRSSGAS